MTTPKYILSALIFLISPLAFADGVIFATEEDVAAFDKLVESSQVGKNDKGKGVSAKSRVEKAIAVQTQVIQMQSGSGSGPGKGKGASISAGSNGASASEAARMGERGASQDRRPPGKEKGPKK